MLSDSDRAILDLERRTWRYAAHKEAAIRGLGLTPTRYYQHLVALLADPDAAQYAPLVIDAARTRARRRVG